MGQGQNYFSLMGDLHVAPDTRIDQIEIEGFVVPGVEASIRLGPGYTNENMRVYLTGEAAEIAYRWLQNRERITVLAQGTLRSFSGQIWPVVTYVRVYEHSNTGGLVSEMTRPDKLARVITANMPKDQIKILVQSLLSVLQSERS